MHQSVLLHEVIDALSLTGGETIVDCTVGGAGHTKAVAAQLSEKGKLVGLDADPAAIDRARRALKGVKPRVLLSVSNFRHVRRTLESLKVDAVDGFIFDLGWSGFQLTAERGFSFMADEPLLMTYGDRDAHPFTAYDVVNNWEESSIADVLYGWGEERFARRIAKAIVARREMKPIATARELGELISHAVPSFYARSKLHPATKTFQAIRIAVNDELGALHDGLSQALISLAPQGKIAVITFHSIEDRAVKRLFRAWQDSELGAPLTKKPLRPGAVELKQNPRARSAKLRVFQKN
ncbi:MAG: 16S rRNA (cytosine(1402)-N(4))-methyltransferase RsmH [Candidatus Pacebacteria bacterium]|nr:16S rRNA (cytosine(1402)-N(4))-methyltransferase RsmH [Candidatus Paceibacterota bacterium]